MEICRWPLSAWAWWMARRCSTWTDEEDSRAEVDCNMVMTAAGELLEVQSTAERGRFDRSTLDALLDLAQKGIGELPAIQRETLTNRSSSV